MSGSRGIPLFDLGNVVVKVDFDPFLAWLAHCSGVEDASSLRPFLQSSLFIDFEFGRISREEFAHQLRLSYGAKFAMSELERAFCGIFPGAVDGMEELLCELAADGPVYALSNTNELHLEWLERECVSLMKPFTKVFTSHELGMRKPDSAIYRQVADALRAPPRQIVFFDDLPANVAGAEKVGFSAHLFLESGQVRTVLKRKAKRDDKA